MVARVSPLARKLLIKPGHRVLALNAPEHYGGLLSPLPEGVQISEEPDEGAFDVVHAFASNQAELERLAPAALQSVKPGGIVWLSYPKRASKVQTDITRDIGWDVVEEAGWQPVTQISVDDVWSALRYRPASERDG
jgi:hypothetical protein